MTIVTTRPRKRPAKPAQAATIKVPRIVQHTPRGRAWKLPPDMARQVNDNTRAELRTLGEQVSVLYRRMLKIEAEIRGLKGEP
jgi:hypothetical protein